MHAVQGWAREASIHCAPLLQWANAREDRVRRLRQRVLWLWLFVPMRRLHGRCLITDTSYTLYCVASISKMYVWHMATVTPAPAAAGQAPVTSVAHRG